LRLVGRAEAPSAVVLRPRIDGQVVSVHFAPGADVRRGQVMFQLDRRMLEAQLAQAEANLSRQRAELALARSELARQTELTERGFVSAAQLDTYRSAVATAEAQVRSAGAAIEVVRTQIEHATVVAPIDGVAGAVLATPGNVVRANDTDLVVINQVDPIQIGFSIPESQLPQVRETAAGGPVRVAAQVPGRAGRSPIAGELAFIDNQVDPATGTIRLTALLPNAERELTPGQFVEVSLQIGVLRDAVVIPAEALQIGPDGTYVWVVDAGERAELRPVTMREVGGGIVGVTRGLASGERIVTDGHLRLVPGAPVEARSTQRRPGGDGQAAHASDGRRGDAAAAEPPEGSARGTVP
jgi:membrane fusion protein, multidrug efflux system